MTVYVGVEKSLWYALNDPEPPTIQIPLSSWQYVVVVKNKKVIGRMKYLKGYILQGFELRIHTM